MKKQKIFHKKSLQDEFKNEGVIKVDFAPISVIQELIDAFHYFHPPNDQLMKRGYYFSIFGPGKEYMTEIKQRFYPIIKPLLDEYFEDYKVLSIILQIKGTAGNSNVGIHQDLTSVNEELYDAATLWIPLNHSIKQNGAIGFLRGSQNLFRGFRAHTADQYQFQQVEKFILKNATVFKTKLGQALIFDPATIHYSPPNKSKEPRLSIALSIVHKDAPIQLGFVDKVKDPNTMEVYDVPDDFYYKYDDFNKERQERPFFGVLRGRTTNSIITSYPRKLFIHNYKQYRIATFLKKNGLVGIKQFLSTRKI